MITFRWLGAGALCLVASSVAAKPIAFAQGWTLMGEVGGNDMREGQVYYAPTWRHSFGGSWLFLEEEDGAFDRHVGYVRGNALLRRWNQPRAQGNVFAWGGVGRATGSDFDGAQTALNLGLQADWESRTWYLAWRSDWHHAEAFAHRLDTVQLGWAPYEHDWDRLATWVLLQARHTTGGLRDSVEPALLLRFFKGPVWLEVGATVDGAAQAMLMLNY